VTVADIEDFKALDPFFRAIERGLDGLVDGTHFFDLLAEDVVFEFVVTVPDYPKRIEGRAALVELYRGYGDSFCLDRCSELVTYYDPAASVAVLEYATHGTALATRAAYDNHFISVVTIADRKVTHWRDYLDPLAVLTALTPR
jgi:ketosteroid isomerase-like protein